MNTIRKIRTGLQEDWDLLRSKHWKCATQKRFGTLQIAPMLTEIDTLDSAADDLQELCQESITLAAAVREPDEIEE